jgi:outer membrane protein assembly factor BamD
MRPVPTLALTLLLGFAAPLASCASTSTPRNLNYGDRARRAYESAMETFNGGDMVDAAEQLRRVRRDFGLSRWAWLADLRLADVDFRQEHYSNAITAYRAWIRYHPTQPEVAYANYMIARCYYAQIPDDWFLAPPSWERDASSAHDAEDAFVHYLEEFPNSEYAAGARDYLAHVRRVLALAEINVADYYASRQRYEAAISRLQGALDTYRGSGLEAQTLLRIGETYLQMGRRDEARLSFQTIVTDYPHSAYVQAAQRYLRFMGPAPAGQPTTPPPVDRPPAARAPAETATPATGS